MNSEFPCDKIIFENQALYLIFSRERHDMTSTYHIAGLSVEWELGEIDVAGGFQRNELSILQQIILS